MCIICWTNWLYTKILPLSNYEEEWLLLAYFLSTCLSRSFVLTWCCALTYAGYIKWSCWVHLAQCLLSSKPEQHVHIASHWQQATIELTRWGHSIIACSRHIYVVLFFVHIPFVVNRASSAMPAERLQQPPFLQRTALISHSFCEGFMQYDLHILVTAPMCIKLRTVAASNNRAHLTRSLYYC